MARIGLASQGHDDEVGAACDRIIRVRDGRIRAVEAPLQGRAQAEAAEPPVDALVPPVDAPVPPAELEPRLQPVG